MGCVAQTRRRIGRFGVCRDGQIEEPVRGGHQSLAKQCPADLKHQLVIVLEAQLENSLHRPHGAGPVAQLEQGLSQAGEPVLVIRIERQRLIEAAARPGVLLPREVGVSGSDVEFDGVGVKENAFLENGQSFIVAAFIVEVMGLFVEVVGAEECVRHRQDLRRHDG